MATAAKKKAAPAAKKAPSKGTAVIAWQDQMAQAAVKQAAVEKVTGGARSISTRSGILSVDGDPIKGNELRAVVLVSAHENQYFTGAFNPNEIKTPDCFCISLDGEDMVPHADSPDVQCDSCDACELNVMGSAETGRGKACKNIRRLMLVTEDAMESGEALNDAEARMLKIPVTSCNNWAKYINRIAEEMQRPSWGVVTLISIVPDAKTQFKLQFEFDSLVQFDQDTMEAMNAKVAELSKEIILPYTPYEEAPTPAPRGKRAAAKKPALPPRGKVAAKRGGKF